MDGHFRVTHDDRAISIRREPTCELNPCVDVAVTNRCVLRFAQRYDDRAAPFSVVLQPFVGEIFCIVTGAQAWNCFALCGGGGNAGKQEVGARFCDRVSFRKDGAADGAGDVLGFGSMAANRHRDRRIHQSAAGNQDCMQAPQFLRDRI